jgi:hypothetical protein
MDVVRADILALVRVMLEAGFQARGEGERHRASFVAARKAATMPAPLAAVNA